MNGRQLDRHQPHGHTPQGRAIGTVEVRWASSWNDDIQQIETMMGLPSFPLAFSGLGTIASDVVTKAKLAAALAVLEVERRPLIWTDDDAIPGSGPELGRLQAGGVSTLLIAPNSRRELQPADIETIEAFALDSWAREMLP